MFAQELPTHTFAVAMSLYQIIDSSIHCTVYNTGGRVVHSYGKLIPDEFPITDLQQIYLVQMGLGGSPALSVVEQLVLLPMVDS